ncbi:MAG: hypothetical protein V2A56_09815 [bacterium]
MAGRKIKPNVRRDPFVVESARRSAMHVERSISRRGEQRRAGWERQERKSTRERHARDRFLMFLFFALAVAVYVGGRAAAPKLLVTLDQGQGDVIVDGQTVGRSGELIRNVTVGVHKVTVKPDDPRILLQPPREVEMKVTWGLHSTEVYFTAIIAAGVPDSTGGSIR